MNHHRQDLWRYASTLITILLILVFSSMAVAGGNETVWNPIGPGGGGRLRAPAMVPSTHILLCGSDMGSSFRSTDNGAHWQTMPWNTFGAVNTTPGPRTGAWAFNPFEPMEVWAGTPLGLLKSMDGGATWQAIAGPWDDARKIDWRRPNRGPDHISFSQYRAGMIVAAFNAYQTYKQRRLFVSDDGGKHWRATADIQWHDGEITLGAAFDDGNKTHRLLVITNQRLLASDDDGNTWTALAKMPMNNATISGVSFGYSPDTRTLVLYLIMKVKASSDSEDAQISAFRSNTGGRSWERIGSAGIDKEWFKGESAPTPGHLVACQNQPSRVYMDIRPQPGDPEENIAGSPGITIFRSDDGGRSWRPMLVQRPARVGFNVSNDVWTLHQWGLKQPIESLSVDPTNPDRLMTTNATSCYLSENAGQTWRAVNAMTSRKGAAPNGGMLVMSAWSYQIDPHTPSRHYIPMTDFGGWMSQDGGQTWTRKTEGNPWHNNVYDVAFDPQVPGRMWSASSKMHDVPFYRYLHKMRSATGGVCRSDDGGRTWKAIGRGHGLPDAAMMSLLITPAQDDQPQRLYVAAMGKGIFVSEDDGVHWRQCNEGIDPQNRNVLRLRRGPDGNIYALSTINYRGSTAHAGAVYVMEQAKGKWQSIFSQSSAPYLLNMAINPNAANDLAVAVMPKRAGDDDGGVWMSWDGGGHWTQTLKGQYWAVVFSPNRAGRVYACSFGHGLLVSDDGGRTWWNAASLPVWRTTNVSFNPHNKNQLYVSAFGGGVWTTVESDLSADRQPYSGLAPARGQILNYPSRVISNNHVSADIYVPDSMEGFYRGTRFDHSGVIAQVQYGKHTYFGPFHDLHDPFMPDAVSGPVDEFGMQHPMGYDDAQPGQTFMKIGVGHLSRIDKSAYRFDRTYPIVDKGSWKIEKLGATGLAFEQRLPTRNGYGYLYNKTITIDDQRPVLKISHFLKNTGTRIIDTTVYCHNFITMDDVPVGPHYQLEFPFPITWKNTPLTTGIRRITPSAISFHDLGGPLAPTVYAQPLISAESPVNQFRIRENKTGVKIQVIGDGKVDHWVLFAAPRAVCPEPYQKIQLVPHDSLTWSTTYTLDSQ